MPRPELPSGTVTFLFTDIEGSTRLLDELGPVGYDSALTEHHRLLREAFLRHDGVEVGTQGDAFFVAFPTAAGALAAAAEGQQALAANPFSVRMGMQVRLFRAAYATAASKIHRPGRATLLRRQIAMRRRSMPLR